MATREHGTTESIKIVATETVGVVGTIPALDEERNLSNIIIHGAGEATCDVTDKGRRCPSAGTGGSVINDGGAGTS